MNRVAFLIAAPLSIAGACGTDSFPETTFQIDVSAPRTATMTVTTPAVFHTNTIAAEEYRGWSTQYDGRNWIASVSNLTLTIEQVGAYPVAMLELDGDQAVAMSFIEPGFSWLAIERGPDEVPIPIDLARAGIDAVGGLTGCTLSPARVLMSLSRYDGSPDDLLDEAKVSADSQGLREPRSWHDVVLDPAMYDVLFSTNKTYDLWQATFAFMSVTFDPLCGDLQVAVRSEQQLAGFVER